MKHERHQGLSLQPGTPELIAEECTWNTDVHPALHHQTQIHQKSALSLVMIPHKLIAKLFSLKERAFKKESGHFAQGMCHSSAAGCSHFPRYL